MWCRVRKACWLHTNIEMEVKQLRCQLRQVNMCCFAAQKGGASLSLPHALDESQGVGVTVPDEGTYDVSSASSPIKDATQCVRFPVLALRNVKFKP